MEICAIYVTYNPAIDYLKKSIAAVQRQVQQIIIVDNSDREASQSAVASLTDDTVVVLTQHDNIGIAAALNAGCREAIALGAEWALTLDQDSLPPADMVQQYTKFISDNPAMKIGAIGPVFQFSETETIQPDNTVTPANALITSGCLMNLQAFTEIGGFQEALFIDAVDTEYSWHLRKHGYQLYKLNSIILEHHIGTDPFHIKLFGKRIMTITNHNYLRCYYIARNSRKISNDYKAVFPAEAKFYNKKARKQFIMVLFFEKDKHRKLKAIRKGVRDYKHGIFGKYKEGE